MNITHYQTFIFDCDGVVLDSNKVKTDAFYQAALPYGARAAQELVDYHLERGGISRYKKFEWFLKNVVAEHTGPSLDELLAAYASKVRHGLLNCDIAEGLTEFREKTRHANWLIVSGGCQQELREVFANRGINTLFDGGIFGSPDCKKVILAREMDQSNISEYSLFIGDSKYDHQVAQHAGIDFLFASDWSEVSDASVWCSENSIRKVKNIYDLMSLDDNA